MNSPNRGGWREVRTGVLFLLSGVPLAAGIFFLDAVRRELVEGPSLVVVAEEIEGLVPGADVWVAGRPAGRVTDVSFLPVLADDPRRVAVRVVLNRDAAPAMRRDAEARIGRSALLSPPVVKLNPGSRSAPPFAFPDTLVVMSTPGLDDFRALADSGKVAAAALAAELGRLGEEMARGMGTLPRLRRDAGLLDALSGQRARSAEVRTAWRASGLRELVGDPAWRARARGLGNHRASREAFPAADSVRDFLQPAFDALRERSRRVADRLEEADGTLGRLATDDELRLQAAGTRALLDSLTVELRENPFRYLRFRLF